MKGKFNLDLDILSLRCLSTQFKIITKSSCEPGVPSDLWVRYNRESCQRIPSVYNPETG